MVNGSMQNASTSQQEPPHTKKTGGAVKIVKPPSHLSSANAEKSRVARWLNAHAEMTVVTAFCTTLRAITSPKNQVIYYPVIYSSRHTA